MAITNQERVGKAMELVRQGLAPFAEREFKNLHTAQAVNAHGGFGRWRWAMARQPGEIRDILMQSTVEELRENT